MLHLRRKRVANERLFYLLADKPRARPTLEGRRQFKDHQSGGICPDRPDSYFLTLERGKQRADWLTEEYRRQYDSGDWWGFAQLYRDWGRNSWAIPHLCRWHHALA